MKKLATDAMFKLEYEGKDVSKTTSKEGPDLNALEVHQSAWKDDYIINYVLRKDLRVSLFVAPGVFLSRDSVQEAKREARLQKEADDQFRKKASIDIPLLPASRHDERLAKLYRSESDRRKLERQEDF